MVLDAYEAILQELGKILKIDLHPDPNNSCLIKFEDVSVQIEVFKEDTLLIVSEIGPVPSGRYRENLFREAMRANGMPAPIHGIFGYGHNTTLLILFELLPLKDLNGERVSEALTPLLAKAKVWKEALSRGDIPAISIAGPTVGGGTGIFGLRT